MTSDTPMSTLPDIFEAEGTLVEVEANRPLLLANHEHVWLVRSGQVDVFLVRCSGHVSEGPRRHVFRTGVAGTLMGVTSTDDSGLGLLASGLIGTRLLRLDRAQLQELSQDAPYVIGVADFIDRWVLSLSSGLCRALPPKQFTDLAATPELELPVGSSGCPPQGVRWVQLRTGRAQLVGQEGLPLSSDVLTPITVRSWLVAAEACQLRTLDTATALREQLAWDSLDRFHQLAMRWADQNRREADEQERRRLTASAENDRVSFSNALSRLTAVLQPRRAATFGEEEPDLLLAACRLIGDQLGVAIKAPPRAEEGRQVTSPLTRIAAASRIRTRQVALRDDWWRRDNGPLLATLEESQRPVALLPVRATAYRLHDPSDGSVKPVTRTVAASLSAFAHTFYRPFPERKLNALDLVRVGMVGRAKEVLMVVAVGLLAGLVALVTPIATGLLFGTIIPSADRGQLLQIALALLVGAFAVAAFRLTQVIAVLRVEGAMDASAQAAIWDRLLDLPAPFFRQFSAGDLTERAMGINTIRQIISGTAMRSAMSAIFSIFSFLLLFYYSAKLALVALVLVLFALVVTGALTFSQARLQRKLVSIQGRIAGLVLQFITGVAKLRVAGAERRVFDLWSSRFVEQKQTRFRAECLANHLTTLNAYFPVVASMVIFAAYLHFHREATLRSGSTLSTGQFLAFNAAFVTFLTAVLDMGAQLIRSVEAVPAYERAKPILEELPEVDATKADPSQLAGEIEVDHVYFRYGEEAPLAIKDVSLRVEPGQFVALVGPSGSGKSTLFRLLLGFEEPSSGTIYYDGQDLGSLDLHAVRRQLGVVLQNSQILAGDIFRNIAGVMDLSLEEAWEAARLAGLEDDIRQMPMRMHTIISQGGTTFSGGQRQRLLIARAIAHKPRVFYFDEATSALDNQTQAVVSRSLENLHVTRVVIAHRLSTIRNADRIFVLKDGELAQVGTYDELIAAEGPFAELARRQIA